MFSNDNFLRKRFRKLVKVLLDADIENIGISELKAANSSRVTEKLLTGNFDLEFRSNVKLVMKLTASQKADLYLILRMLRMTFKGNKRLAFLEADLTEYFKKKCIDQNDRYFYLSHLDDIHFEMYCYDILFNDKDLRFLSRRVNSTQGEEKNSVLQVLLQYITDEIKLVFISRQKPKKLQRHKGYRDHGSLGSEYSQTIRQQAEDYSVQEIINEKISREETSRQFLEGLIE